MSRKQEGRNPRSQRPFNHHHMEQLLANYRHLTPDEQTKVEEHLKTCADCRRQLPAFQQMDQLLQQIEWQIPQRRLQDGFYAAVAAERTRRPSLWAGKWPYVSQLAGQTIGLVLLAVMIGIMWLLMRQQVAGPAATSVETSEQLTAVPSTAPLPNTVAMQLKMTLADPGSADILTLSQDGQFLAAAQSRRVQIWATGSGRLLQSLDIGAETAVAMTFTPNDLNLVVQTSTGQLQRWRVAGGARLADSKTPPVVASSLPFAVDNSHLAVATADNRVELWEIATGSLKKTVTEHGNTLTALSFVGDSVTLLAGDSAGVVHLWDLNTNAERRLIGPQQPVVALAVSPLGDQIAAGFADGQVKFWSHPDGTALQTLPGREAALLDMHFADDGDNLRRLLRDGTLERWPIGDTQPYSVLTTPTLNSGQFAFLPGGLILAGITADGSITLWEKP